MPRAFTEAETREISEALLRASESCLARYGVKKTTVDELARRAGISKGSFYRFHPSKEALFFHTIEEYQKRLFQGLFKKVQERELRGRDGLTEAICYLFSQVRDSFLTTLMRPEEMALLLRGLPQEQVSSHHTLDDETTRALLMALRVREQHANTPILTTALRALAMAMMHREAVGEELFDEAMRLLIRGLVLAGVEEEDCGD